jgi:asparagine synthase (glutamine-hydrolysing)
MDHPGFYASHVDNEFSNDSAILLHDQRGAIFGKLYPYPTSPEARLSSPLQSVSRDHSENIVQSMGRSLISQYWGYYVAVLRYPERQSALVMRSPVSPLACFHMRLGTLNIFFSYLEDCAALKLAPLSINWDSITAQVVGGDYLTRETGIREIESLECGEAVECSSSGCIDHVYWDPHSFLRDRSLDSFPEATRVIRHAVDHCVNALSYGHDHILVNLSGGLDSSIILSALGRSPHRPVLTAVNYYSRGCGDERNYARSMARSVNCRLVEYPRNDGLDLRRLNDCNFTVRPVLNFSAPDVEARTTALARESKASAIFNGELGDNIFGRAPGPGVLVECIRQNGYGRQFLRLAMDYSMLVKQSFWQTLASTHRERQSITKNRDFGALRRMQQRYGVEGAGSLILASAESQERHEINMDRFLHPWLKQARELAPGSDRLLFGLIAVTSPLYHSPFADSTDPLLVSPLIAQPLVEIALRMPSYLHCRSGQDRAVARKAFADVLPFDVLHRGLGKGGPDLWARDVLECNSEFMRDFLANGILVRRGLVDRTKLETVLSHRIAKSTAMVGDIFAKLYIEAWLRKFQQLESART